MSKIAENFDPEPGDRIYVRSERTGDLGWMVRRDGVEMVRLDRPSQEIIRQMSPEWVQVVDHRPCSHAQVVQVAFMADKALCALLGLYEESGPKRDRLTGPSAKKDWRDLNERQLIAWLEEGPSNPPIRRILYNSIVNVLEEHMVGK